MAVCPYDQYNSVLKTMTIPADMGMTPQLTVLSGGSQALPPAPKRVHLLDSLCAFLIGADPPGGRTAF